MEKMAEKRGVIMEKTTEKAEKKNVEIFETWMKMQKEYMDTMMKSQKELMDNWMEASTKIQESLSTFDGRQMAGKPGKEMLNVFSTWLNTMVNSSKILTEEGLKIQEAWKTSLEKQMSAGKEIFKGFAEHSSHVTGW